MTLKIDIDHFESIKRTTNKMQLYVTGSKAGSLISEFSDADLKWQPRFRVDCSEHDTLKFTLFALAGSNMVVEGETFLNCLGFMEREKSDKYLPSSKPVKYELALRNGDAQIGILHLWIFYDPLLLFEGEMPCKVNLSLRFNRVPKLQQIKEEKHQIQESKSRLLVNEGSKMQSRRIKGVEFYVGKCPTVNTFSFFDEAVMGQKCSFAEQVYREKPN